MTKNISPFLPTLPITKGYLPAQNQNTICKIVKLAGFLLVLPFLLIADLLYSAFYCGARVPKPIIPEPPKLLPTPPTPEPAQTPLPPTPSPIPAPTPIPAPPEPEPTPIPPSPEPEPTPAPVPTPEPTPAPVVEPIVPQPQELSLWTKVGLAAFAVLGVGTLAYLIRSYTLPVEPRLVVTDCDESDDLPLPEPTVETPKQPFLLTAEPETQEDPVPPSLFNLTQWLESRQAKTPETPPRFTSPVCPLIPHSLQLSGDLCFSETEPQPLQPEPVLLPPSYPRFFDKTPFRLDQSPRFEYPESKADFPLALHPLPLPLSGDQCFAETDWQPTFETENAPIQPWRNVTQNSTEQQNISIVTEQPKAKEIQPPSPPPPPPPAPPPPAKTASPFPWFEFGAASGAVSMVGAALYGLYQWAAGDDGAAPHLGRPPSIPNSRRSTPFPNSVSLRSSSLHHPRDTMPSPIPEQTPPPAPPPPHAQVRMEKMLGDLIQTAQTDGFVLIQLPQGVLYVDKNDLQTMREMLLQGDLSFLDQWYQCQLLEPSATRPINVEIQPRALLRGLVRSKPAIAAPKKKAPPKTVPIGSAPTHFQNRHNLFQDRPIEILFMDTREIPNDWLDQQIATLQAAAADEKAYIPLPRSQHSQGLKVDGMWVERAALLDSLLKARRGDFDSINRNTINCEYLEPESGQRIADPYGLTPVEAIHAWYKQTDILALAHEHIQLVAAKAHTVDRRHLAVLLQDLKKIPEIVIPANDSSPERLIDTAPLCRVLEKLHDTRGKNLADWGAYLPSNRGYLLAVDLIRQLTDAPSSLNFHLHNRVRTVEETVDWLFGITWILDTWSELVSENPDNSIKTWEVGSLIHILKNDNSHTIRIPDPKKNVSYRFIREELLTLLRAYWLYRQGVQIEQPTIRCEVEFPNLSSENGTFSLQRMINPNQNVSLELSDLAACEEIIQHHWPKQDDDEESVLIDLTDSPPHPPTPPAQQISSSLQPNREDPYQAIAQGWLQWFQGRTANGFYEFDLEKVRPEMSYKIYVEGQHFYNQLLAYLENSDDGILVEYQRRSEDGSGYIFKSIQMGKFLQDFKQPGLHVQEIRRTAQIEQEAPQMPVQEKSLDTALINQIEKADQSPNGYTCFCLHPSEGSGLDPNISAIHLSGDDLRWIRETVQSNNPSCLNKGLICYFTLAGSETDKPVEGSITAKQFFREFALQTKKIDGWIQKLTEEEALPFLDIELQHRDFSTMRMCRQDLLSDLRQFQEDRSRRPRTESFFELKDPANIAGWEQEFELCHFGDPNKPYLKNSVDLLRLISDLDPSKVLFSQGTEQPTLQSGELEADPLSGQKSHLDQWIAHLSGSRQERLWFNMLKDPQRIGLSVDRRELLSHLEQYRTDPSHTLEVDCSYLMHTPYSHEDFYKKGSFALDWFLEEYLAPRNSPRDAKAGQRGTSEEWAAFLRNQPTQVYWFKFANDPNYSGMYVSRDALLNAFENKAPLTCILHNTTLPTEAGDKEYVEQSCDLQWFMDHFNIPDSGALAIDPAQRHRSHGKQVRWADEEPKTQWRIPQRAGKPKSPRTAESRASGSRAQPTQKDPMKRGVFKLIQKGVMLLNRDVRSAISNGIAYKDRYGNFSRRGGFRIAPPHDNETLHPNDFEWNFPKLYAELEKSLPYIFYNGAQFDSVDSLLEAFNISRADLQPSGNITPAQLSTINGKLSTLCCLTHEVLENCRRELKAKLTEFNAKNTTISMQEDAKPRIEISFNGRQTAIQASYDFYLYDRQKESRRPLAIQAIVWMRGKDTIQMEIRPQINPSLETTFIGGKSARFRWTEEKERLKKNEEEASIHSSTIPPLEDPESEGLSGYLPDASTAARVAQAGIEMTSNLAATVYENLTHQSHLAQDHKYQIALSVQMEALQSWLAANVRCQNDPADLLRNLKLAYAGRPLELPYERLLSEGCNKPFVLHVSHALEALCDTSLSIRSRNTAYHKALRKALNSDEYKDNHPAFEKINALLRELCFQKFAGNRMQQYEEALLELVIQGTPETLTCETIADAINTGNHEANHCIEELKKTRAAGAWQKLTNALGVFTDPLGGPNIPEVRSIHLVRQGEQEPYPVLLLRHGTPTWQPQESYLGFLTTPEEVIPEYRAFLEEAEKRNMPVLYVNHQKMWPAGWADLEGKAEYERARAINALENTYDGFHFLSLPYDGEIWKDRILRIEQTSDWKRAVVDALVHEKHGFKLPKGCDVSGNYFLQMADAIHGLYFRDNERELDAEERKLFLMIFYSYVKEVVKAKYNIRLMASPCKDDKDRGNASKGVDEALYNLRCGLENNDAALHRLYVRTLAPFIIKYEGIIEHRLHPLLSLLDFIATLTAKEKEEIRAYCPAPGYSYHPLPVEEEEIYPIHTDISSAVSLRDTPFDSLAEFIHVACPKAGTVYLPAAQSKVIYNSGIRNPKTNAWDLEILNASLGRRVSMNGIDCQSYEELGQALKIEAKSLYDKERPHYNFHIARLSTLTKEAVSLCDEGLEVFLRKNSTQPIAFERTDKPPQFKSHLVNQRDWETIIEQEYVLKMGEESIRVTARTVTNSQKQTQVTVFPTRE